MDRALPPKKLDALTSLRFIAAAMIVIGHSHGLFGSLGLATTFSLSQGVSFFFVLSGFILAYNYTTLPNHHSAWRFIVSRFARIWPLHIATTLIWLAVLTPTITREFDSPIAATVKLILNIFLLQSWSFQAPYILSFNGVAWSISTEAFFYIVFAAIAMSPVKRLPMALGIATLSVMTFVATSAIIGVSANDASPGFSMFGVLYTNPLVRIFEFLFGIVCARIYSKHQARMERIPTATWLFVEISIISLMGYALYAVASPYFVNKIAGAGAAYYVFKEGLWSLWGLLIIIFACSNGPIARLFSVRPLVFLGEISFALYLVHAIIINLANSNPSLLESAGRSGVILFWLTCILVSAALHISVETPFRRLIIGLWEGKKSTKNFSFFKAPQYIAFTLILCGFFFASTYQPSTVVAIQSGATGSDQNAHTVPENKFSNGIKLTNINFVPKPNDVIEIKMHFELSKKTALDRNIGVHLNDTSGNILKVIGNIVIDRTSIEHPKGFSWTNEVMITRHELESASTIGIAIFQQENQLDKVVSGLSDWDSRRLIIDLSHQ
jgi:peptidoglycan/LPS O-acetylase OafA/YrhL